MNLNKLSPEMLSAAVAILQAGFPDIDGQKLVSALCDISLKRKTPAKRTVKLRMKLFSVQEVADLLS